MIVRINNDTQGRFWLDIRKPVFTRRIIRNWKRLHRACVECLFPGILKIWWEKALSKLLWTQCWPCFEQHIGLDNLLPTWVMQWFYSLLSDKRYPFPQKHHREPQEFFRKFSKLDYFFLNNIHQEFCWKYQVALLMHSVIKSIVWLKTF